MHLGQTSTCVEMTAFAKFNIKDNINYDCNLKTITLWDYRGVTLEIAHLLYSLL